MTTMLDIRGLAKSFDGHTVLDHIDLTVAAGSTTAVVGSSGCGKTTLLRLVAGFETPDAGTVTIAGRQVASPERSVAPASPQRRLRRAGRRAVPAPDRRTEHRVRAVRRRPQPRRPQPGEPNCSKPSPSNAHTRLADPMSSPAASSSALRSPAHWPASRC